MGCSGVFSFKSMLGTSYHEIVVEFQNRPWVSSRCCLPNTKTMSDCVYPCPCGYFRDPVKPCTCTPSMVIKYQKKISGLLLGRIDIHIEVPRVAYEMLSGDRMGESSESIRARVQAARDVQRNRFSKKESSFILIRNFYNSSLTERRYDLIFWRESMISTVFSTSSLLCFSFSFAPVSVYPRSLTRW